MMDNDTCFWLGLSMLLTGFILGVMLVAFNSGQTIYDNVQDNTYTRNGYTYHVVVTKNK